MASAACIGKRRPSGRDRSPLSCCALGLGYPSSEQHDVASAALRGKRRPSGCAARPYCGALLGWGTLLVSKTLWQAPPNEASAARVVVTARPSCVVRSISEQHHVATASLRGRLRLSGWGLFDGPPARPLRAWRSACRRAVALGLVRPPSLGWGGEPRTWT